MCTSPIEIHRKSAVNGRVYRYIVPCGKCPECLNTKQNDNAVLSYLEAIKRGKLVFVTFTYNNDTFPVRCRVGVVGKVSTEWQSPNFVDGSRASELRSIYCEQVDKDFSTVVRSEVLTDVNGSRLCYEFCPSLRRKDFQKWLKSARVNYERKHGESLDFSYMLVGEYGEQNHRPHYHACFYGLDENVVRELVESWSQYGFYDVKLVQRFNGDPSHDGFFAASRYLGKYLTKGEMDSYNVLCGLAEKSRVCRSIGFGVPDKRKMQSLLGFSLWKIMMDIH